MAWRMSTVRDISHHNTIGDYPEFRRFARPVSIPQQISHFLDRKTAIGTWERPDMLDCEFVGITGGFIRALKDEYRRQSGISQVQIYIGLHDIITTCPPNQWWDEDVYIQVARYRKIGPPDNPDAWRTHLGFDHPGLSTYQWDNATPFYPGGPTGDVSYDRVVVSDQVGGSDVNLTDGANFQSPGDRSYAETKSIQEILGDTYYFAADANRNAGAALERIAQLEEHIVQLKSMIASGVEFVPEGSVTLTPKPHTPGSEV